MASHAAADHRNLGDVGGAVAPGIAIVALAFRDGCRWVGIAEAGTCAVRSVVAPSSESVCTIMVDIDVGLAIGPKIAAATPRLVLDLPPGKSGFVPWKGVPVTT